MGRHFSHRHESAAADIARRINSRQQPDEVERVVLKALAADIRLRRTTTVKLTSLVSVLFWARKKVRGSRVAESLAKSQRPLEPDAGNADEGRSDGLATQPCDLRAWLIFLLTTNGATGMSDIEGKAARVAASEAGVERVSMDTNKRNDEARMTNQISEYFLLHI